jgi:MazG family protein
LPDNYNVTKKNGCPWDQKQTTQSLKKYIQEECAELLEAMEENDPRHICEESGDLFFLLILLAEIQKEQGFFNLEDVLLGINEKMIRRHPHVFANSITGNEQELREQWEKIKIEEQSKKTN